MIRDQVQRRYGLNMDHLSAHDREQAQQERRAGRDESSQAAQLLAEASREDQNREQDATEENQRPQALAEEAGIKNVSAEGPAGADDQSGERGRTRSGPGTV